ncbi:MAG: tetratricopeptide repeat protein [Acidobacteria bacterium]|nr:tetratricopeptide repeat protein [Acidobacteriota bacterium]
MDDITSALEAAAGHFGAGRFAEAEAACRATLLLEPGNASALHLFAHVALRTGRPREAAGALSEAAAQYPDSPELQLNLGVALKAAGDLESAATAYARAVALRPEWPEAHYNLAAALHAQGHTGEAVASYAKALALRPAWPEALNGLGVALLDAGETEKAAEAFEEATALRPGWFLPLYNLGKVAYVQGRMRAAADLFREAAAAEPGFYQPHLDLAVTLLRLGEFEEGWREYEWRWGGRAPEAAGLSAPLWDGSPLAGRTLLLWAEQGLGDTIQFSRYVPLIRKDGGRILLRTQRQLARLLENLPGVDAVVGEDEEAPADFQLPLLSLARVFGTTAETIPDTVPYLSAPTRDQEAAAELLAGAGAGLRVGIVWASGTGYLGHEARDCRPADFASLARVPGVRLFGLQFGAARGELSEGLGPEAVDLSGAVGDFATTAAFVERMDLIITVDTAMAHLAGALGRPVWVLLNGRADWRWMESREDSPWYPTMRLFRQSSPGGWAGVFGRVESALDALARQARPVSSSSSSATSR